MSRSTPTTIHQPTGFGRFRELIISLVILASLLTAACASSTDGVTVDVASGEAAAASEAPTAPPTAESTIEPTAPPTAEPTAEPTAAPTAEPTAIPTNTPEVEATTPPAAEPNFVLEGELPYSVAEINDFIAYVEDETGRAFLYPPHVIAQDLEAFEAGLVPTDEELRDAEDEIARMGRYLQVMGLTDLGMQELSDRYIAGMTSSDLFGGYYDPDTDAVYLPNVPAGEGAAEDELFRSLLVHELVHALDAQHIDLQELIADMEAYAENQNFEAVTAMRSVIEGRATAVQQRWMFANAPAIMAGGLTERDMGVAAEMPPSLIIELQLAYTFGAQMVEAGGGAAETWHLYDTPPASSELVLFPDTPADEPIVEVASPAVDGPVIFDAEFGASDLFVWLLGENASPGPEVIYPTLSAVDGWAGGQATLSGDDTETCIAISLVADSPGDLTEMVTTVTSWVEAGENRTIAVGDDQVDVGACAPWMP